MSIAVLGGEKGGVGKTTIAANLAVFRAASGRSVLLVDADKQGSSGMWAGLRAAHELDVKITCVSVFGDRLADQVRSLAQHYDDVIIDTRGADAPELRSAMLVANILITPIRSSQFDLYTMGTMSALVMAARGFNPELRAVALINQATTNSRSTDTVDAKEALEDLPGYEMLNTVICMRKAWMRCASEGKSVTEINPADAKAAAELTSLAGEVFAS